MPTGVAAGARESRREASISDALDADKTSVFTSAVANLNCWAVDRPDIKDAVRMCSKSLSGPGVNDWHRAQVKGCPASSTRPTHCAKRQ